MSSNSLFNFGNSVVTIVSTLESVSSNTGSLVISGGVGIAKTLYVGTNIFLAGNAVSTQSYVQGLLSSYQPLTSGTPISALTLALTGTLDSTSTSSGSLITAGGLAIAKNLYVGTNIFLAGNAVATQTYVTSLGYLTSAFAAATYLTTANATSVYQPLTSGTSISALTLTLTGTTDSSSISTGSFITSGGLGIAKNLYVGTNIFLAGNAVATQAYVTGLGYLTSAFALTTYLTQSSAAAVYQPLTANTAVSALTLSLTSTTDSTSVLTGSLTASGGLSVSKNIFVGSALTSLFYNSGSSPAWYIIGLYDASAAGSSTVGCRSEIKILTGSGFTTGVNYGGCVTIQLTTNNNSIGTSANVSGTYFTTGDSSISVLNISFVQNGTNRFSYFIYANFSYLSSHTIHAKVPPGVIWTSSMTATTNPGANSATVSIAVQTFSATIAGMTIYSTSDSINSASGSLATFGGLGVAKTLYVGTNIFLAGSAVATQTFVTSLGYLTITSAAAVYQPLTAGTAISALSLSLTGTADSTSISTGTFQVSGGIGIAKTLYVGSNIFLSGSAVATQSFVTSLGYLTITSAAAIYQPLIANTAISALSLSLTGTADSTSISTGTFQVSGGIGIAKTLYVGSNIFLSGSAVATQSFVTSLGYLTTTSAAAVYQPLTAGTAISALSLSLTGTADSTSISTGTFQVSGGIGIAKTLYVGSNIFLSGSAVATQSFVTSLGYLTTTLAAAVYQPLTAGTAISALSLSLTGTADSTSISTGTFQVSGGIGIAKTLYVGSNIFLSGSAVATQSFVTSLGYLTTTSAAAVYQPLTAGTAISALSLSLTGTADSTSISTGTFQVSGGIGIAKTLYVGSNIFLSGSAVATQSFVTSLGYLTTTLAAAVYQPLTAGTAISALSLSLTGTADSTSISTGTFQVSGGIGIAKTLYVGSNIFLSGSAVATQSFVTSLGYLTTTLAAAVYQPLTAGTAISALSLSLTGTADSTSISTGTFQVSGGIGIAKTLYVGSNIFLSGSAVATQSFVTSLGYLTTTLAAAVYQPLTAGTAISALSLSLTGTADSTSISTGTFQVSGGIGIAKTLYVGSNIFLSGSAVATQSFVTSLGYLTTTSAAAVYQPLTAGTAISALSLSLTGTADSTSISTGTFQVSGGIGIAKTLYVGSNIFLSGSAVATQSFVTSLGYLTTTSAAAVYQPLTAGTAISALSLSLTGTADSTSISTGTFQVSGGIGIAKTLYVGSNIFLSGSAVATQSFVTSLGYLTTTSAAAVYQPLTAGTAISALSLSLTGTADSISISTGSFQVSGGAGIAKTLYVGSNIFLSGSAVATQSFVTGLGYLTSTSAAAVYQPLISGTSINALTLILTSTADSTSISTGSLTTLGGTAIAKSLYVGGLASIGLTLNMNSNKILNLATPILSTDAANKGYVDSVAQGLSAKNSVVLASTAPLTLSTGFSAGSVVDGITLTVGMRILIKDQSSLTENGIYLVTATAPTRTSDFPTGSEQSGAYFFVESGTINADYGFVCVSIAPNDVVGTSISFSQFSGAGQIAAGTGLTKSGSTLSINANQTQITQLGTLLSLSVSGLVTLTGTADAISSINGGAVTISGGIGIAKTLYVGSNIFLSGSAVATQSFVTGLGYLTTTSAAAIYQPLIANTAISALSLSLTGTADSTSVSTGSFQVLGGAGIAKTLYVGSNIFLSGSAVATQSFVTGLGYLTTTSAAAIYQPLIANTAISALSLSLTGTADSTSVSTGSFQVLGGAGIAKTLYVGSNIFLSGSAVATQSFVTGLGYLTTTSAAAIYQPLIANTAISALSLSLTGTADSTSVSTGSFQVLGGAGIAKTLYVGSNIFLSGSAVATQSFVTGLGYLTTTSAAAIYQPLIANTAISALSLSLTGTADSTSVSTGSFQVLGGAGIAKTLYVGSNIFLSGSAVATQSFVTGLGYLTTTSAAAIYQPLIANTAISALSLSLTGTADSTSVSTGSFQVLGGAGIAKTLYVGSNIFLSGSAVATQSFVTGLGYLTTTSAAAIYQPLIANTAISALSLSLTGTADSTSVSTGSFQVLGGAGIAKTLYVGSNIFLSGSAVATQSFVTGLGYLTTTSAAAIYQPLIANTAISALSLSLTGTADSTSVSTGSFQVLGGAGIAKTLYVGSNIFLSGSAVATQSFVTGLGYLTTTSAAAIYQPLIANTAISALSLSLTGTADSTSVSTGSFQVLGGAGIAKTLYVGSNIFLSGSAVATQSFVTGLGYLTTTSAAAIYQPLIANTAISALSLSLTGTADSTSVSTGSFVTAGGAGVSKNLSVGSKVQFFGTNSQYVALRAPASPANISLTLPASLPSVANSYLVSDTAGILSFSTSGGTGSSTPTSYSFSGANSQTTPANVTAMVYSSGNFELNVSVNVSANTNLTQLFLISAVLSGGASLWNINAISVTGDNSGVIFSITSAGQVQYTSSTYPGFTALTINWSTFISVTGGSNLVSGTNSSGTPSGTFGALFYVAPSTFTDINTAASGTVSNFAGTYIGAPTLSASNTSITTTSASTMFIPGPPVAGTNETITNSYSLQVASGNVLLSGTVDAINSTSGGTLNTSGGVVIGKQLYAQQHKTISGTVAIPSAGTYYILFGISGFIGKVSAYITSITNGIWASQGTILMPPGNLRANLSNVTAYQYNSGAGSQIAASLQPFAGTNSNAPTSDSPSNSVQVVVTTITSASTLVWSLIVFQNWI